MKEFWKILEENESLLNLVTAGVCFAIIGIIALLCWIFGQVVRMINFILGGVLGILIMAIIIGGKNE